jgi:hypothetical protein
VNAIRAICKLGIQLSILASVMLFAQMISNNITLANIDNCMPNLQIALIAFTSASSGKQIESYYSTFCVSMRAAFN